MHGYSAEARKGLLTAADIGVQAARRLEAVARGRGDLLTFAKLTSPDAAFPEDLSRSRYTVKRHHSYLASILAAVEMGLLKRVIISMPPRHGKSELASRKYLAWTIGRDPTQSIIFATYNEEFALDFGRDVRGLMKLPVYEQMFPNVHLSRYSQASDRLATNHGGVVVFVGRGGSITGRGAHKLVLDDPIKDRDEANSRGTRNKMWGWFTDVAMSRLMDDASAVVIILTRWHEDDIVGRLVDPKNPLHNAELAAQWTVINLSALAQEDDPLDRPVGEPLWPEKFSAKYLEDLRRLNPESFSAIWQGNPSPLEGAFFTRDCIVPYSRDQLPTNLRLYGASDHAITNIERNDKTCMGLVGVDSSADIWVLPDLFWRRSNTMGVVAGMLEFFKRGPMLWWAEKDQIYKSIEPFLRQRMMETGTYAAVHQLPSSTDLVQRAQPIHARMSMGKVHLPRFAHWYQDAVDELLSFPNGSHDDFVSFMSLIGRGLQLQVVPKTTGRGPILLAPGTLGYLKNQTRLAERRAESSTGGM